MRAFTCGHCGQLVFFENSLCLRCATPLGFAPWALELVTRDDGHPDSVGLVQCSNAGSAQCNWMLEPTDPGPLCRSCRLTRTRPSDADAEGLEQFAAAEAAKRRLLFQLLDLGLAFESGGLQFDLLTSRAGPVVTGHNDGVITIDLAESDDARREQRRAELDEPYRTLLGHFRHEVGHFFWPPLVEHADDGGDALARFRELFGDERADYAAALERHYAVGAPADWNERHVSTYATSHPWEDWAETFAHYLHIRDTLQTAAAFRLFVGGPREADDPGLVAAPAAEPKRPPFATLVGDWLPLTYALNAVNRSMGRGDLYPFTLAPTVIEKLSFVHERVSAVGSVAVPAAAGPRV
jgi:hypothetical protein